MGTSLSSNMTSQSGRGDVLPSTSSSDGTLAKMSQPLSLLDAETKWRTLTECKGIASHSCRSRRLHAFSQNFRSIFRPISSKLFLSPSAVAVAHQRRANSFGYFFAPCQFLPVVPSKEACLLAKSTWWFVQTDNVDLECAPRTISAVGAVEFPRLCVF